MKIKFLASSSSGNCTIIQSEKATIAIDAGITYKKIVELYGTEELKLNAICVTHEHYDHISGVSLLAKKTNAEIYMPKESYLEKQARFNLPEVQYINTSLPVTIEDIQISFFQTKHDSAASVGITLKTDTVKFGFLTDTGVITKLMKEKLKDCDAYFLESDYDEKLMDECEEYDDSLKLRIKGPYGHMSNQSIINFIKMNIDLEKIKWIAFGHLSKHTNTPTILYEHLKNNFDKKYLEKFHIISDDPLTLSI